MNHTSHHDVLAPRTCLSLLNNAARSPLGPVGARVGQMARTRIFWSVADAPKLISVAAIGAVSLLAGA